MEFSVSIQKNEEIDRLHAEERRYAARLVQKIAKSGANLLLVQKSIIRDAVSPLALHFLARKGVMVVTDVERDAAPSVAAALGCRPVAAPEDLTPERLGSAASAEERSGPGGAAVFVRGAARGAPCASVLLRGSSRLVLAEAERSLHDALCVVRCLVRAPAVLPGGAAAEMELAVQLRRMANEFSAGSDIFYSLFA